MPFSIGEEKMFSGIFSSKVMCSSVSSAVKPSLSIMTFPFAVSRALSSVPFDSSMNALTLGPSLPNCLPITFMTGTAVQSSLSQMPLTTVTERAFARSQQRSFIALTAAAIFSESVATTISPTGQRPLRFPFWRALATASSNFWTISISSSRTGSRSESFPPNQSTMWTEGRSPTHFRF